MCSSFSWPIFLPNQVLKLKITHQKDYSCDLYFSAWASIDAFWNCSSFEQVSVLILKGMNLMLYTFHVTKESNYCKNLQYPLVCVVKYSRMTEQFFAGCLSVYFIQCWARTASLCTPPCSTHTCTWSVRMRRASPTSGSHSLWTPRATLVPANQRRPGCGIVAMASGSMFTSTAQERLLHHYSDQVFSAHTHTHSHTYRFTQMEKAINFKATIEGYGNSFWQRRRSDQETPRIKGWNVTAHFFLWDCLIFYKQKSFANKYISNML